MSNRRLVTIARRAYVAAVVVAGGTVFARSLHELSVGPLGPQWFILVGLTLLTGSFTIKMSALPVRVSVSETFVFASVLLYGTSAGTVTVVVETLVISFWFEQKYQSATRVLFNAAAPALAIWISASIFYWSSGIQPYFAHATPLPTLFLPLAAFTALYFLLNTWLVAIAVGLHRNRSPIDIWWPQFTWVSINYFSGASVAALIVTYSRTIDLSTLAIIIPLLAISYLTFRTAMARVDDATRHLTQLNNLYLSTIETLAMAIDAKDQITHGHIRRVQSYAVNLAKQLGVEDDKLIRAIEAAALLHDMGKLAVPEYILNKPGKLTKAEFEKMKLHATVGADILSAIDFPYPVVPIVRHHHENWDGSGYPTGLNGTDIPIGARILSVVDCFDALTSDRPYRPKLSDDEAISILVERRASMYDPLIVDTFIKLHKHIAPPLPTAGAQSHALREITGSTHALLESHTTGLDEIAASGDEMLTLYELANALAGDTRVAEAAETITKHLRRLIPFSTSVFYSYHPESDELEAVHAAGDAASIARGIRIPVGQRLSGWVAANRQPIINSDPVLDLGDVARSANPRLRSCLSAPIVSGGHLIGVLTLYSSAPQNFSDDHRRILETVGRRAALALNRGDRPGAPIQRSEWFSLPSFDECQRSDESGTAAEEALLICLDSQNANDPFERISRPDVLRHVSHVISEVLVGSENAAFRYNDDTLGVVIRDPERESAASIARRLSVSFRSRPFVSADGLHITVDPKIIHVGPAGGAESLARRLAAARGTNNPPDDRQRPRVH